MPALRCRESASWPLRALSLLGVLLLCSLAVRAQPAADPDATLEAARTTVQNVERELQTGKPDDARLREDRRRVLALQQEAEAVLAQQTPALQAAQARLAELGAPPPGGEEAPDVAARRRELQETSGRIEARIKLARLLGVESAQLADRIATSQRERFRQQLFERTDSPLLPDFWVELRSGLERDVARVASSTARPSAPTSQGLLAVAALAAGLALRVALGRVLKRFVTGSAPAGRLRRSFLAIARSLLAIIVPGAVVWSLQLGLRVDPGSPWHTLLDDAFGAACFAGYVGGLGSALLSASQPSWRLPPLSDASAGRLRDAPALLAVAIFATWMLRRLTVVFDTGLATAVASDALVAVLLGLALARPLWRLERPSARHAERRRWWVDATLVAIAFVLAASLVTVLVGYVALGSFVVRQLVWAAILIVSASLLAVFIDDAATAWRLVADPVVAAHRAPFAVLASGVLRLCVLVALVVLLLAPFGESPHELLLHSARVLGGLRVGELELRPIRLLQAIIVLALALTAVTLLKRWLAERFLPTTGLDAGIRTSLVTLFAFVGSVVAVALALSALGLALEKVAWIASALSVGIGFGLQAVVSNFVSGLILLAERPVRVGDRVSLGGAEGEIRRINVRATEIQLDDRSTLIVPNSEFITKVVRNLTLDHAPGLVQLRLPLPLSSDVEQVRGRLLAALEQDEDILKDPPPAVHIESIDADRIVFVGTGFVAQPRMVQATRSALLANVLAELRPRSPS